MPNTKKSKGQSKLQKLKIKTVDFQTQENIAKEFDTIIKELLPAGRYEKSVNNVGMIASPDTIITNKKFLTSKTMIPYDAIRNYADTTAGLKPALQNTMKGIAEETVASPAVNDPATIIDLSYDVIAYAHQ
jgi:hypothetical protein